MAELAVHQQLSGRPRALQAAIITLAVLLVALTGSFVWFAYDLTAGLPDKNAIRGLGDMAQATTIYDASDQPAFTIFKEQRIEVPLDKVSPNLIKAVISVEDQRFYEHSGVDVIRIGGAVAQRTSRRAGAREGGSTITQQLARQSFLTPRQDLPPQAEGGHPRRAHRARCTRKDEILELYLNKVYFGDGLYGVEAASRGYFGKHAQRADGGRGGAARRAGQVAVELRADGQPRSRASRAATSCCRRWCDAGAIDQRRRPSAREADAGAC